MSSKEIRKLQDGDKLEFVFGVLDDNSGEPFTFEFGGFTVSGPITVKEVSLFDATFYYAYEITDIFGRTYMTDFAVINSQKGQLTIEKLEKLSRNRSLQFMTKKTRFMLAAKYWRDL